MSELKPCPFCGTSDSGFRVVKTKIKHFEYIECSFCLARGPEVWDATEAWNERKGEQIQRFIEEREVNHEKI